jgi:Tol biopolymer transport system component
LWRLQDGQASEIWKGSDGALAEAPAVSPDGLHVVIVLRKQGKRQLTIVSADGSESKALAASIDALGAAEWAPGGDWIVTGGSDSQGPGLFKIPVNGVDGGTPVRLTKGVATNPVWSPDDLIVYAGPRVASQEQLAAVRSDGSAVDLPPIQIPTSGGGHRLLPGGKGLVYTQSLGGSAAGNASRDFWLLDFITKKTRQLAHFTDISEAGTFDITPDGKQIVFDRSRENSDIVLIDLPR